VEYTRRAKMPELAHFLVHRFARIECRFLQPVLRDLLRLTRTVSVNLPGRLRIWPSTFVDTSLGIFAGLTPTVPIEDRNPAPSRQGIRCDTDLVKLPGARFVRASEAEQERVQRGVIKRFTAAEA